VSAAVEPECVAVGSGVSSGVCSSVVSSGVLSSVIDPPCGATSPSGDAKQQGDQCQDAGDPPEPFARGWSVVHGQVAACFGQGKGLHPFGVGCGGFEFFAVEVGPEAGVGPFGDDEFARCICFGQFDVDGTIRVARGDGDGLVVLGDACPGGCGAAWFGHAVFGEDIDACLSGVFVI